MLFDITLPINNDMIIYPGDRNVTIEPISTLEEGGCNMTGISIDSHTGTHLDTPLHFIDKASNLDNFPTDLMISTAKVFKTDKDVIDVNFLKDLAISKDDIILFKTRNQALLELKHFSNDFVALSENGAEYLVEKKIRLVGVDYLTIEKRGSKDHSVHKTLLKNGIYILEALYLNKVPPGKYKFYCFPLKISQADGAPVRVLLETL